MVDRKRGSNICMSNWVVREDMGENLNLMYQFLAQSSIAFLTLGGGGGFQSSCHGLHNQIRNGF